MISFFFKPSGAGLIDGQQIGEYLGARLNPKEDFLDDVCIYVKQEPPPWYGRKAYVNIVDSPQLVTWAACHPNCGVITTSLTGKKYLEKALMRPVVWIPEHHCNIENYLRPLREVKVVGVIGNMKGFNVDLDVARKEIEKSGMELRLCDDYQTRQDVVDFYKSIDIQLCWRPHVGGAHAQLHNPLKLANACSFGIPTIAFPEDNFKAEFDGLFFPVYSIDDLWQAAKLLSTSPRMYENYSMAGIKRAKNYHISEVAKLYLNLGR